ncbi:MAG: hypothetical protein HDR04_00235 [Lachnospiraceae bacterium]|nr:hypothetical protein [Lachnospiraceae bacterium]
MNYIIYSGQFEKGTQEQQAVFSQLLGSQNVQYKFDLYFHWYNIIHEYGHCLCEHYNSNIIGLKQEFLVNRFAVSIWQYAGYEQELNDLKKMINETLQRMKDPVPDHMSFTEYYEQIWGTEELMQVPIYGYFQFKSVQMALENKEDLETVLTEMGIRKGIGNPSRTNKKYQITADTAKEVLHDIRYLLDGLGIEQPPVDVELVDDPSIQCANCIDSSD